MTGSGDQQTLDPEAGVVDLSERFARRSTLAIRRLTVGDRRVVAKIATGRTRAPLRAEASVARLIGPSLTPEVIAVREHDDRTDLVLDDVGWRTAADLADVDVAGRLVVLEACARGVDALHRAGWTHGALCAEHVVLDDALGVRFVSLGSARPLSDAPDARADDLRQLFGLVEVVARTPLTGSTQRARWRRTQRALRRLGPVGPARVGSAHELALAISRIPRSSKRSEDIGMDGGGSPSNRHRPLLELPTGRAARRSMARCAERLDELRGGPLRRVAAAVAVVTALVGLVVTVAPRAMSTAPSTSEESRANAIEPLVDACPDSPPTPGVDASSNTSLDLTGDGCADHVRFDGTTVQINGVPHRVGVEGDQVTIADDDCDGVAQIHLLRPSTGERFVFDALPEPGVPVRARLRTSEPVEPCAGRAADASSTTSSSGDPP